MYLRKRDIKRALKAGGSSYVDVCADIEATIDEAMNSTDPEVQANFKKYFGNKRPTLKNSFIKLRKRQKFRIGNSLKKGVMKVINKKVVYMLWH